MWIKLACGLSALKKDVTVFKFVTKRTIFLVFISSISTWSMAGDRFFLKDHPSAEPAMAAYKKLINLKHGEGTCGSVYAFNAGSPTDDLNMIYVSCDQDKSEWNIGVNSKTGEIVGLLPIKLYGN